MPFNGAGTFSPPASSYPAVASTLIESAKYNAVIDDLSTGLTTAITKDGQTTITANLPMATYRHTGVGNAANLTDYASADDVIDNTLVYGGASSAGTDAYAVSLPVSPGTYKAGQRYSLLADVDNTGACTANYNAIGDASIKMADGSDPFDGAIQADSIAEFMHDGTNLILLNPYFKAEYVDDSTAQDIGGAKKFTSDVTLNSAAPGFILQETGAAADEGKWLDQISTGERIFYSRNDAESAVSPWLRVNRTGIAIDTVNFPNGELQAGGNKVWDDSGSNGPAAVSGYTKAGSGVYTKNSIGGPITMTFNNLVTLAAPTGATGVMLSIYSRVASANAVANRNVNMSGYSDAGTTECVRCGAEMRELVATAASTLILETIEHIILPVVGGNVYFKYAFQDAGANGGMRYVPTGYTV